MKKLLTVFFVIFILCSFAVTAFASDGEAEAQNVFEIAFEWLTAHSSEILSALTFVGSVTIAFTYKKGLLPRLSGALTKIGGSVSALTEETEKSLGTLGAEFDFVKERAEETEKLCMLLSDRLASLSDKLDSVGESKSENDKFKVIMSSQVDMLYEIFMQSSLPQYAKDSVGEKIAAMKAAISGGESDND